MDVPLFARCGIGDDARASVIIEGGNDTRSDREKLSRIVMDAGSGADRGGHEAITANGRSWKAEAR